MCVCCQEQDAVNEKRDDRLCIMDHPDFEAVCLTPDVLHIIVNSMEEVRGYGVRHQDWTNRLVAPMYNFVFRLVKQLVENCLSPEIK